MRKLRTAFAGALLVLAALIPVTPAAAAAPAGTNLQLMSWNMCDSQRASWNCAGYGTFADKLAIIKSQVANNYVQAMLLQEICENDLTTLMGQLGSGWSKNFAPYYYSNNGVLTNSRCGEDNSSRQDRYGTAIVIHAGLSNPQIIETTQPWNGQNSVQQCATATYFDNIRLCNLHISRYGVNPDHPTWDYADDQLAEVKAVVDQYDHVAFGGDLNVVPPDWAGDSSRDWVWPAGLYWNGTTGYRECDQSDATNPLRTGRSTTVWGVKFDHIFSTQPWRWCGVIDTAYSDHSVVVYSMKIA
ncbi:endonuclease/exonuclease/phosphatase family protein [Actinoplanes sp. NPDC051494]|uniref:endonuclease/exonuclease/phosphatase family protein n=1 Tax=Actinoplanes sp. NPDC051494 TaxID=3363907 RepID=UPI0037A2A83D